MDINKLRPECRWVSFTCAARGVADVFQTQPNTWIMAPCAFGVFVAAGTLGADRIEWCLLTMAAFGVVVTEVMNTAVEYAVDLASPELNPLARKAKDASAGAVLLSSILALLVGLLVLGPKVVVLFAR